MADDLEEDYETGGSASPSGEQAPSGKGRGTRKKILLFVLLPLFLVVGAGAGAYFSGVLDLFLKPSAETSAPSAKTAENGKPGEVQPAVFYDLPEMLVNLNSTGRKQNFLKIRVSLELKNALDVSRIEQVIPRIIDNFQVYLRELRIEDLQGSAGMLRLREELLARVNAAVAPATVNDILFKEILVQ